MRGNYQVLEQDRIVGSEEFDISATANGWEANCRVLSSKNSRQLEIVVSASQEGGISSLELRSESLRARYRWEEDAWVGRMERPAKPPEELSWPMTRELQPVFGSAVSDRLLFRRIGLGQHSQKRVEVLEVRDDHFETEQTYVMLDRLGKQAKKFAIGTIVADQYRQVDAEGNISYLWVDPEGWVLEKSCPDGRIWRLTQRSGN